VPVGRLKRRPARADTQIGPLKGLSEDTKVAELAETPQGLMRMSMTRWPRFDGWGGKAAQTLLLMAALAAPAAAQERYHPALDPRHFPVPTVLAPNVAFWRDIFSKYTSSQTVIHDSWHLDVVFSVVDMSDLERIGSSAIAIERARDTRVKGEIEKYQRVLRRLGGDARAVASAADVERVRALYDRSSRRATDFRAAVERVRGQGGLRDTFAEAIRVSGMFMPGIERILSAHGLPIEIRCMPFVESMFNYRARSRVGASGVWQFTASTARLYRLVSSGVDARHDVWLAADAAARMLKANYASLRSWPLALTSYNHGVSGMARATRQLGTKDIGVIAERYRSRSFGFASRNFYAEFLAAVTVFADRATLFPGVEPMPAATFDEFTPGRFVSLLDLASLTQTNVETLETLNPALHDEVVRGRMLVPGNYPLRVPAGTQAAFQRAFAQLPSERKRDRQLAGTYRVARGDTLATIARRFGTTSAALQRANGLARASRLRVGQVLEVGNRGGALTPLVWSPTAASQVAAATAPRDTTATATRDTTVAAARDTTASASQVTPASRENRVHVIRRGENLYRIARRYGLTVAAIVAANDLGSPDRIVVGTELAIPTVRQAQ
jgi:membrane-bound lytic murein transglycosylase D